MVTLPPEFVATKYPGYFWNIGDKKLYSVKVSGELRRMAMRNHWQYTFGQDAYSISIKGRKKTLFVRDLQRLVPTPQVFPVAQIHQPT